MHLVWESSGSTEARSGRNCKALRSIACSTPADFVLSKPTNSRLLPISSEPDALAVAVKVIAASPLSSVLCSVL